MSILLYSNIPKNIARSQNAALFPLIECQGVKLFLQTNIFNFVTFKKISLIDLYFCQKFLT